MLDDDELEQLVHVRDSVDMLWQAAKLKVIGSSLIQVNDVVFCVFGTKGETALFLGNSEACGILGVSLI